MNGFLIELNAGDLMPTYFPLLRPKDKSILLALTKKVCYIRDRRTANSVIFWTAALAISFLSPIYIAPNTKSLGVLTSVLFSLLWLPPLIQRW